MSKLNNPTLHWDFPSTSNGEEDGLNDPLQKYFEGDHERFVAREAIQNTIDARNDYNKPVAISFERFDLPTSTLPGVDELKDVLTRAQKYSDGQEGSKEFYSRALEMLNSESISVLKISDSNTIGLNGSDTNTKEGWYRLIRSAGASSQTGAGGGSFGIGKGAPFAASGLRTVFYSTCNDKGESVFQGKIRISSFVNDKNDVRRGMGMYGIPQSVGVSSVRDEALIPEQFKRTERGTDIYIIGYLTQEADWRTRLIQSVLNNFWAAIHFKELNVKLIEESKIEEINSGNIKHYFTQNQEATYNALACYEAVINPDAYSEDNLKLLGKVKLYVKMQPNYPKVVQLMRLSKMLIQELKFRVLPTPHAAVFICEDREGNKKLRTLEAPAHDRWDPDLNSTQGKQIYREFYDWIKTELRKLDTPSSTLPDEIPDLSKFLPKITDRDDDTPFSHEGNPTEEISEDESYLEKGIINKETPPIMKPQKQIVTVVESASFGLSQQKVGALAKSRNESSGLVTDEKGAYKKIDTTNITFRNMMIGQGKYMLVITPTEDDYGSLTILVVGEDNNYPAEISSAINRVTGEKYNTSPSEILGIKLQAGTLTKIEVNLKTKRRYVLGVE